MRRTMLCRRNCPAGLADELPEGSGVYRFFGEDGRLAAASAGAASLRAGVCGHFAGEHADARVGAGSRIARLAAQVRRVDWVRDRR